MNQILKTCIACGEEKSVSEFHIKSDTRDKLQPKCKTCQFAYFKAHYAKNKDKYLARSKEQRLKKAQQQSRPESESQAPSESSP